MNSWLTYSYAMTASGTSVSWIVSTLGVNMSDISTSV